MSVSPSYKLAKFDDIIRRLHDERGGDLGPRRASIGPILGGGLLGAPAVRLVPQLVFETIADAVAASEEAAVLSGSLEGTVADQLMLSDHMTEVELEQLRRRFAFDNHPDRAGDMAGPDACARMMVANDLIDRALARVRSRQ